MQGKKQIPEKMKKIKDEIRQISEDIKNVNETERKRRAEIDIETAAKVREIAEDLERYREHINKKHEKRSKRLEELGEAIKSGNLTSAENILNYLTNKEKIDSEIIYMNEPAEDWTVSD